MARVIQVIEVDDKRGAGTVTSPHRNVRQYWSLDGEFLMERDDWLLEELHRMAVSTRLDDSDPSEDFRNEIVTLLRAMR